MTTNHAEHLVKPRDLDILGALDRVPLTADQLLKLSGVFDHPFGSERMVRERLQALGSAGWVRWAQYATTSQGAAPKYFLLTRQGWAILHGREPTETAKRQFAPLPITRHAHTRALADFLVHTTVAAHTAGHSVQNFYRENALRLTVDGESLLPDGALELIQPGSPQLNFVVEVDGSTERIHSRLDEDSWQRKIRLYDRLQDIVSPDRFRVLVVCTRSRERVRHILEAAYQLMKNPKRMLFYGIDLASYLATADAVRARCFLDQRCRPVGLISGA